MDGVSILDNRTNFGLVTPLFTSVDRVGEVQVITSPADAEIGRGGAHIVIISRSGTNQFHASVFKQLRNTDLNTNSFFNNFQWRPRNILVRNQFGTGVDGPIVKNKTFFRFHIESQRLASQNAVTQTVYYGYGAPGAIPLLPRRPECEFRIFETHGDAPGKSSAADQRNRSAPDLRGLAFSEYTAPDAEKPAPTVGSLRCPFLASPLVHGCQIVSKPSSD